MFNFLQDDEIDINAGEIIQIFGCFLIERQI